MPLAEFLRFIAQSHITLIHGKCGKLLKDSGILGLVVWVLVSGFCLFIFVGLFGWFCSGLGFLCGHGVTQMTHKCVLDLVNFASSHSARIIRSLNLVSVKQGWDFWDQPAVTLN